MQTNLIDQTVKQQPNAPVANDNPEALLKPATTEQADLIERQHIIASINAFGDCV